MRGIVGLGASFMSRGECDDRDRMGVDRIMWGSDYPHLEGTWPSTMSSLHQTFEGVSIPELRLMLGENAVRCYHLDGPFLRDLGQYLRASASLNCGPPQGELPEHAKITWAFRDGNAWY